MAGGFQRQVGRLRARQARIGIGLYQAQRPAVHLVGQGAVALTAGGDDDDFEIGPGLCRGGRDRTLQNRPLHAADQDGYQRRACTGHGGYCTSQTKAQQQKRREPVQAAPFLVSNWWARQGSNL